MSRPSLPGFPLFPVRAFGFVACCLAALAAAGAAPLAAQEADPAPPEAAQPEAAQPEAAQPEAAQPEAGQPEKATPENAEAADAEAFGTLHQRWEQIKQKLSDLQADYAQAEADQQATIRKQYGALVEEADQLMPKLQAAAEAAYQAAPAADPAVVSALIGFMNRANTEDRYEEARRIGEMLREGGAQARGLAYLLGVAYYALDDFDAAQKNLQQAADEGAIGQDGRQLLQEVGQARKLWQEEQKIREQEAAADDLPRVALTTTAGKLVIELYENEAPGAVGNFVSLVEDGFYDGLTFHRVLPGFMAQGGDPDGTGAGGPGYAIYCECDQENHRKHFRGTLSMAHAGKDTGGSQFFLTFRRTPHLDGRHTVFGRVIEGHDVLAKLERRDPSGRGPLPEPDKILKAEVIRKRDHKYEPNKVK